MGRISDYYDWESDDDRRGADGQRTDLDDDDTTTTDESESNVFRDIWNSMFGSGCKCECDCNCK